MQPLSPLSLFNAHALPTDDKEPHARIGNHLRVNSHPLLGLPVAPFIIHRAVIKNYKLLNTRSNVVFRDKFDRVLVPPFNVTPDNPVTATIPLVRREQCLWAQVDATSGDELAQRESSQSAQPAPNPNNGNPFSFRPPFSPRPFSGTTPPGIRLNPFNGLPRNGLPTVNLPGNRFPGTGFPGTGFPGAVIPGTIFPFPRKLTCEAFIDSAMGPTSIGSRSIRRWAFSGPGITEIRISGWGRISGLRWIEASDQQRVDYQPFAVMGLPHGGGSRYLSINNALMQAIQRVATQTPKRKPLQETTNAPNPPAAPLANVLFERQRVQSLAAPALAELEPLINDLTEPPLQQQAIESIIDENGDTVGTSSMQRLAKIYQLLADPGTATLLGFKLLDHSFKDNEDNMVFYRVDGFFEDFPASTDNIEERPSEELLFDSMVASVPTANRGWSRQQLLRNIEPFIGPLGAAISKATAGKLANHQRYFGIGSVAIADRSAPLDPVAAPQLPAPTPPKTDHKDWLPATPPDAVRAVEIEVTKARTAGLLAAGKRTPAAGINSRYTAVNKANGDGFHLPLVLALNSHNSSRNLRDISPPAIEPGTGFIGDRDAAPEAIRYFVAQQDRFGRWSDWAARVTPAGPRPKPPRPEFQAFYTQPDIANAGSEGGKVLVKVMVPDAEALAPGSHLLKRLQLTITDQTTGVTNIAEALESNKRAIAGGDPNTFFLNIHRNGPLLRAAEQRKLKFTARWIDVMGGVSNDSTPQTLNLSDPRPPEQLPVPDKLQYSARPDVTGLSWVEFRWTPQPGQHHFGVYYSDENRLIAHLENIPRNDIISDIAEAPNAAARATLFRNHVDLFPDYLFERLRDVNVNFNSGQKGFRHGVSGSLRLLNFYKIAAEAESGSKPVLTDLPMIVYGVPNSDPPPRPTLQVAPVQAEGDENNLVAEVTIELLAGTTAGRTWRLRRSAAEPSNPLKMPVVEQGPLGEPDTESGRQSARYRDDGPVKIATSATLKPWVRYSWVAEVQGAPESGSEAAGAAVAGRWSRSSDPVSLVMIPPDGPAEPVVNSVTGTAVAGGHRNVDITFSHSDALTGGTIGNYRLRISRKQADAAMELVHEAAISGTGPFTIGDELSVAEPVASGTEYFVEIIDPVGRRSARASAQLG